MNKQIKWIAAAAAFVVLLIAAGVLYRHLSSRVEPEIQTVTEEQSSAAQGTKASVTATTDADDLFMPESTAAYAEETLDSVPTAPEPTEAVPESEQTQAADFTVLDASGNPTNLSAHFGKPLVVNFWATWCGPCRSELPAFDAAAKANAGKIEFMMVNLTDGVSETVESVRQFVADAGYTFPVYYDTEGSAAFAYSISPIPMTVFIRADGTVLDSHIGAMNAATLQNYLDRLAE